MVTSTVTGNPFATSITVDPSGGVRRIFQVFTRLGIEARDAGDVAGQLHQHQVAARGNIRDAESTVHVCGGSARRLSFHRSFCIEIHDGVQRHFGQARRCIGVRADNVPAHRTACAARSILCLQ
jgi:hypothetical protein